MALTGTSPAIGATNCPLADDQRHVGRPQGRSCDIGAFEFTDFVNVALTVDPSGTINLKSGAAVNIGTMTCSAPATIPLSVTLSQPQKLKRVSTIASASGSMSVVCNGKTPWAIAFAAPSGGFAAGDGSVAATTVDPRAAVLPASLTCTHLYCIVEWNSVEKT